MIVIKNIGGDQLGISDYEVRINHQRITTFSHNRADGLAKCLERSANAVEREKWLGFARVLVGERT